MLASVISWPRENNTHHLIAARASDKSQIPKTKSQAKPKLQIQKWGSSPRGLLDFLPLLGLKFTWALEPGFWDFSPETSIRRRTFLESPSPIGERMSPRRATPAARPDR